MESPKLPWFTELSNAVKTTTPAETVDQKAIRLFAEQLQELEAIKGLNYQHPNFLAWRDRTTSLLQQFLRSDSPYISRFRNLKFYEPPALVSDYPGVRRSVTPGHSTYFTDGCAMAAATINAIIRDIGDFGVKEEAPATKSDKNSSVMSHGGVHFHEKVSILGNQAIAADNAIQTIGQVGDRGDMGATLKEIAELFQQSMDLSRRQVHEGLSGIEELALEVQKEPSRRDWKAMIESGEKVLGIAGKAIDLAQKLAPFTPTIVALVEKAKHMLGT
jgi:hypothetical protein